MKKPKKTLILLHAALGAKSQLTKLSKTLSQNFDLHLFDFEGHGVNSSESNFSIDLFTKNLSDYILKNNLKEVSIFGYSMGGYVALNYAKGNTENLHKIITFGTKIDWSLENSIKESNRLNPEKIEEKVPQFASLLKEMHKGNNWKDVMTKTAKMMLELGDKKSLKAADFQQITTPVLITVGTNDTMISIEESQYVVENLQNAQLKKLENFVHPLDQNDLEILTQEITNFLS